MSKTPRAYRLPDDTVDRLDAVARSSGLSRNLLVETALEALFDSIQRSGGRLVLKRAADLAQKKTETEPEELREFSLDGLAVA